MEPIGLEGFVTFVPAELEERAAAEVMVLRACTRVSQLHAGTSSAALTVLDSGELSIRMDMGEHIGAGYGVKVARDLAALQLVAAVKVLDMFVEWVLDGNGVSYGWQASKKVKAMRPILGKIALPAGFDVPTWERVFDLFVELTPYRNAVAHAGWGSAGDKGLQFACDAKHPEKGNVKLTTLVTHEELATLRETVCAAYDIMLFGPGPGVLGRQLSAGLNALARFHGLGALAVTGPASVLPVRRTVCPAATVLADFDVDLEPVRAALARGNETTRALEVTFGDPDAPLTRYLIPWELIALEKSVRLGPQDTKWSAFRIS